MPPKKGRKKGRPVDEKEKKTPVEMAQETAMCGVIVPGPKYKLKTLVGYKGHCISKFRNPAYTLGEYMMQRYETISPGPKYKFKERRRPGYTFGMAAVRDDTTIGPGPKYKFPRDRGIAFLMKWRTKQRKVSETPGPYTVKHTIDSPAYTMGLFTPAWKYKAGAGPYTPDNINVTKPKAPIPSIALRYEYPPLPRSPGPIYNFKLPRLTPAFSFGTKHSPCAPPYITECDDRC
ncbi:PREDICTED: outer dense fiber protein 3-like [Dinoponera quadriceps]|uniref:Outer dense fiber protein 3-like n=1 Tax=Dinoponera quadriceps TaxID=609295 RepID=A0A6P3XSY7_DINQU|nr:PREDICTED: outer dense fiber protein 3-like [Dinoponera quadriceps]